MNKTITCEYTYDELVNAMAAAPMINHKRAIISSCLLIVAGFLFMLLSRLFNDKLIFICSIIILVLSAISLLLDILNIPSVKRKVFYKKTAKANAIFKDGVINTYTFLDDKFILKSKYGESEASANVDYSAIAKLAVYNGNLYLFLSSNVCYLCKETFNNDEFSELLSKFPKKVKKASILLR